MYESFHFIPFLAFVTLYRNSENLINDNFVMLSSSKINYLFLAFRTMQYPKRRLTKVKKETLAAPKTKKPSTICQLPFIHFIAQFEKNCELMRFLFLLVFFLHFAYKIAGLASFKRWLEQQRHIGEESKWKWKRWQETVARFVCATIQPFVSSSFTRIQYYSKKLINQIQRRVKVSKRILFEGQIFNI